MAGAGPAVLRGPLEPARTFVHARALRLGAIGGAAAVLIAAIGLVEAFAGRVVVSPSVTFGYIAIAAVPFIVGYAVGKRPAAVEGVDRAPVGPGNVLAGSIAGLVTASFLAGFVLLASEVNLRPVLVSVSPRLLELLTFGDGTGTGIAWILLGGVALGAIGGAFNLLGDRWRRPVGMALVWTLTLGLLQVLFSQVLRTLEARFVVDFLYTGSGGLTIPGAFVVALIFFGLYAATARRRRGVGWSLAGATPAERRRALLLLAVLAIVLIFAPQILGNFLSEVLDLAGIYLLMALGLNIVVGYAGLLDLGYVAFFAVGAYTAAVLTSPTSPQWSPEFVFWTAIPFIMLAAALAGLIVGTPVLRMRGDYLAIVTLGFGEIARILFLSDALNPYFGGAQGIISIPNISIGPIEFVRSDQFFYLIYGFVILLAYASWALQDSRIGRAWMAMREDEDVAEATGVSIVQAKLTAFVIGAVFASFGGALFAHKIGSIFPHSFSIIVSITVLMLVIVGGMGSIPGVILASLVLVGVPELLREFSEYRFLMYGALLVFMMLYRPEGFLPSKQRSRELHSEEASQDEWLRRNAEREEGEEAPAPAR